MTLWWNMKIIIKKFENNYPKISKFIEFFTINILSIIFDLLVMAFTIYFCNLQVFSKDFFKVFLSNRTPSSWSVILGSSLGFIFCLILNYFLSHILFYRDNNTKKSRTFFLLSSSINLLIQIFGIFIGYSLLHKNKWIIKILFSFIFFISNSIQLKYLFTKNSLDKINTITNNKMPLTDSEKKKLTIFSVFSLAVINFLISATTIKLINGIQWGYFFGCDSPRILEDWSTFQGGHYRIKVHPLYVILTYPIFRLFEGLGCDKLLTATIFISFCITFSEILLYKILNKLNKNTSKFYPIFFTLFYCICFSTIESLLVIESFSLASVSLLIFFDWYTSVYYKEFKLKDYCILAIMGVVCFSIVITNLIIFIVGVICLLFNKKRIFSDYLKFGLKLFLACICSMLMNFLMCEIQSMIFNSSQNAFLYLVSIFKDLFTGTRTSEEFLYMGQLNKSAIKNVIYGFWGYSFCGGNLLYNGFQTSFSPTILSLIMTISIASLLVISIITSIKRKNFIVFVFAFAYFSQLCLHLIYGNGEILLYTFQSLFLVFCIFQCGLPYIREKFQKTLKYFLILLSLLTIIGTSINIMKLIVWADVKFGFNSLIFYGSYDFILTLELIIILIILISRYRLLTTNNKNDNKFNHY